jgi:hypothetical protein
MDMFNPLFDLFVFSFLFFNFHNGRNLGLKFDQESLRLTDYYDSAGICGAIGTQYLSCTNTSMKKLEVLIQLQKSKVLDINYYTI